MTVPVSASGGPMSDERPPTPAEVAAMHLNVGRRLTGLVEIARKMGDDPEWIADKAWLVGTASDVTDYIEMAVEAASRLRAVLTQHGQDFDWLQMALGSWEAFRPVRATNEMRDVLARIAAAAVDAQALAAAVREALKGGDFDTSGAHQRLQDTGLAALDGLVEALGQRDEALKGLVQAVERHADPTDPKGKRKLIMSINLRHAVAEARALLPPVPVRGDEQ